MNTKTIDELKQKFSIGDKAPQTKISQVQAAIKNDLPGWQLTEESFEQMGGKRTNAIEDLKAAVKKDLPQWHLSPAYIEKHQNLEVLQERHTIMVRLNNESIEKVAEYKNGRVQIIQG